MIHVSVKMKSYCLKCRKDTENKDPKVWNTSNSRKTILSKCAICGSKRSSLIKNQEARGLLISLVLKHHYVKYQDWVIFWVNVHAKLYIKNEWNS